MDYLPIYTPTTSTNNFDSLLLLLFSVDSRGTRREKVHI